MSKVSIALIIDIFEHVVLALIITCSVLIQPLLQGDERLAKFSSDQRPLIHPSKEVPSSHMIIEGLLPAVMAWSKDVEFMLSWG